VEKPKNYFFKKHLSSALTQIYQAPMTVIIAPPGYGKEVAVSYYTMSTNALTLWVNVPKGAGGGYFCGALKNALSQIEGEASVFDNALPICHGSMDAATSFLRDMMAKSPKKIALVIDNFQNIPEPDNAYRFLAHVASCNIPHLHIVLLSTRYLPVSADDLLNGTIARIGKSLFCLDNEGIERFFASYGIEMSKDCIKKAATFSEGWLSALSALANAILEKGAFDEGAIADAKRRIGAYLREAIWTDIPDTARNFLTMMSITDAFTPGQARNVCLLTGTKTNAEAILKLLEGRHVLDICDDGSYRMHNIMLSLARKEAKSLPTGLFEMAARALAEDDGQDLNPAASRLSAREWEVLELLQGGKKYKEIAAALYISQNTVKTVVSSIYRKLGIQSKKELVINGQ